MYNCFGVIYVGGGYLFSVFIINFVGLWIFGGKSVWSVHFKHILYQANESQ